MYEAGALFASMSGSGSTVFGIFKAQKQLSDFFPTSYFCKWV
jgi:4-diphosphocytidyl-2C-methyl-D-erythritol kinase